MDFAVYLKNQQEGSGSFCTAASITEEGVRNAEE
jgi:hypothetical protein